MVEVYLLIGVAVIFFLLKGSKTKDSHETINEKNELAMKNKEVLKEKIQNDLKNNKIDHVFVSIHSKKYHTHKCRFYNDTMSELPLDIAIKEGYIPCKICYHKKKISV
ncbi:MAG: hypothetical protein B6227_02320 [Fusobacteriia bacterium 4572_74]|nr:MAG: hypothetical protein B6227_02320 [Fusobacteriia bacterium 4572_74]